MLIQMPRVCLCKLDKNFNINPNNKLQWTFIAIIMASLG